MTATQELVVPKSIPTMELALAADVEKEFCGTTRHRKSSAIFRLAVRLGKQTPET